MQGSLAGVAWLLPAEQQVVEHNRHQLREDHSRGKRGLVKPSGEEDIGTNRP